MDQGEKIDCSEPATTVTLALLYTKPLFLVQGVRCRRNFGTFGTTNPLNYPVPATRVSLFGIVREMPLQCWNPQNQASLIYPLWSLSEDRNSFER